MGLFPDSNQTASSIVAKFLNRSNASGSETITTSTDVGHNRSVIVTSNTSAISSDSQRSLMALGGSHRTASKNMQLLSTSWEYIRPTLDLDGDSVKGDQQDVAPPQFLQIKQGRLFLGTQTKPDDPTKDKEAMEERIMELEEALSRLQTRVDQNQCNSPTVEKDLREQLDSMNRALKIKERRAMQTSREHKTIQARFSRQENCLQYLQNENKSLQQRVRQYEHCLDDVMRKVVDAIVAEDNLREEVSMLKNRVRDLEAQNAALSTASPAKGRDEGYCTMSSGQPPPSISHLENLPEEPEQLLMLTEPCSAEMEDWSMSQEELGAALEDDCNEHDWIWNSSSFLNSTIDSQSESISQLLQETIIYSEDEEIACKDFTNDFYRLVNIQSDSIRSLHSPAEESDTSSESGRTDQLSSTTPSEAGLAQVVSCSSSSDSSEVHPPPPPPPAEQLTTGATALRREVISQCQKMNGGNGIVMRPAPLWRRSTGWRRIPPTQNVETSSKNPPLSKAIKTPPPVPIRRTRAS